MHGGCEVVHYDKGQTREVHRRDVLQQQRAVSSGVLPRSLEFLAISSVARGVTLGPITTSAPHQRAHRMQLLKTTMKGDL
jgi:hypothetical protein